MTSAEERFTSLYEQHYAALERYVYRRAPDVSVRDVVADVFLVVWRRLDDVPEPPLPWIYGIARRVLANEIRGSQRRHRLQEKIAVDANKNSDDHAEHVASRAAVAAAFEGLSEADKEALRLVAWEALSARDAATAAGCSLPTFAMRLHRARRRLLRNLEGRTDPSPLHQLNRLEGDQCQSR
jgi:RNA polymerase sigma factor (sigma-70 family)